MDNDSPTLIIQSYYVHQDNYALRVRLKTKSVRIAMTPDLDPLAVLEKYRDEFRLGISHRERAVRGRHAI